MRLPLALRAVSPRRFRSRMARPIVRRRFPSGEPPREVEPVPVLEPLWRSPAFAAGTPAESSTHVGRLHRHYGEDVLEAARAGDAVEARRLVETWIEAHAPRDGDAWHPYPLSTRVGNWIAALTLEPGICSPELSRSLWRQLLRLRLNVESDVAGRHRVRNARALVLGGAAFGSPDLVRRGIAILRREVPEQVLPDGGHVERSPTYHLVVLRDLLEVHGASPHSWLGDAIERMRVFAAALARPDGAPALFNDGTVDAPLLDLPKPAEGLTAFPESGFVVVREGRLWLAFRCGPSSPPALTAHAHADALSFQLWWCGRPVVVDPGSGQRATAAHSTITVDGRDQFALGGGRPARVALRYARDEAVEASVVLPGRVRHVRRIEWDAHAGEVLVVDSLEGKGRRRIENRLVLASGSSGLDIAVSEGELVVEPAWVSERPGERTETIANVSRTTLELPAQIRLRLSLS